MKLGTCLHLEEGSVGGVNIFLSFLVQLLYCEEFLQNFCLIEKGHGISVAFLYIISNLLFHIYHMYHAYY